MALSGPTMLVNPIEQETTGALATGSFTPSANALVFVVWNISGAASATGTWTDDALSVTGGAGMGTWTQIQAGSASTNGAAIHIFYAQAPASPASMNCSASCSGVSQRVYAFEVTGHNTSAPVAGANSTFNAMAAPSLELTEAPTTSDLVIGLFTSRNDTNGMDPGSGGSGYTQFVEAYDGAVPTASVFGEYQYNTTDQTVDGASFQTTRTAFAGFIVKVAAGEAKSGSDTSSGASASTLEVAITTSDTGTDTEATSLTVTISSADTATAVEEATKAQDEAKSGADTPSATEGSSLSVTETAADTGSDTEASSLSVAVTGADTSTATEGQTLDQSEQVTGSDTPSATEGSSLSATMAAADTSADTESATLATSATASETASGATQTASLSVSMDPTGDTPSASDSATLATGIGSSDTSVGTEGSSLSVDVSGADTSTATEDAVKDDGGSTPKSGTDDPTTVEATSLTADLSGADTSQASDHRVTLETSTTQAGSASQYVDAIDATVNGNGTWATTGNAVGSTDANYAVWTSTTASGTGYLDCSVDLSSVPSGATITSTTVYVDHKVSNTTRMNASQAQAFSGGSGFGSPTTLTKATGDTTDSFTITATAAQLRATDFMVRFTANKANTTSASASLDWIRVDVEYTTGSTTTTDYLNPNAQASASAEAHTLSVTITGADTATDTEGTTLTVTLTASDTATATEGESVNTGSESKSGSDDPSTTEATSLSATMAGSETSGSTEGITLVVAITAGDTATAVEAVGLLATMAGSDTSSGTESQSLDDGVGLPKSDADTGGTAEVTSLSASSGSPDTAGLSVEQAALTVTLTRADTATTTEAASLSATLSTSDTATDAEVAILVVVLTADDLAAAVEATTLITGGARSWKGISANTDAEGVMTVQVQLSGGREATIRITRLEG